MGTQKNRVGKMTQVKKGGNLYARCYVTRNGIRKEIFLGRWGLSETEAAYHRVCAELHAGVLSEDTADGEGVSLAELFDRYLDHAEKKYKSPEIACIQRIIGIVYSLYPQLAVKDFRAMHYRTIQEHLVTLAPHPPAGPTGREVGPWSRQYVNRLMKTLRSIFKWGISYDMVPPDIHLRMTLVPAVMEGDFDTDILEEREDVEDVSDRVVLATIPFMAPIIADMVRIQRGASMRPSEVCSLRVGDIDRSGPVWVVRKKKHKTSRFGGMRFFAFGPAEVEILRRRCRNKGADQFVFSPRDAMQEKWAQGRANRKTKVQPSQVRRGEKAEAKKLLRVGECYTSDSYRRAIDRAQERARKAGVFFPHWFPYQLRHAAVTENALKYGPEKAGKIAGHKSPKTTEIYNHSMEIIATDAAKERTKVLGGEEG